MKRVNRARTRATTVVLAATALALAACGGKAGAVDTDGRILHLALNQSEDHPSFISLEGLDDRLQEATDGQWEVDVFPNETLGAQQEALQLVSDGIVDMAVVSGPQLETLNKDFIVFNLPRVFDSVEHQRKVLADPAIVGDLYASLEDKYDITVLGGFTQGARNVYTTDGPVVTPDDLRGQKIRVQESELQLSMIRAMGGSATPMAYGEVYTALQSGVLDGAENNEVSYVTQKHYEVAPYYSRTEHVVGLDYIIINSDSLASMPPDVRASFDDAWAATGEQFATLWQAATEKAVTDAVAGGATITEVDQESFDAVLEPLALRYLTTPTQQQLYDAARSAADEEPQP